MMKYTELKAKHRSEFDDFPIQFAFNQKQLDEGLKALGATQDEVVRVIGGGFIRREDSDALIALLDRHTKESVDALQDDAFLIEAIEYELGNHEYSYTGDPEPALSAIGISLADERVSKLFKIAKERYLKAYYAWEEQQSA